MHKLWVIIKREYAQVVKKKSFLLGIVLTPLFMIGITIIPSLLAHKKSAALEKIAVIDLDNQGIGERFAEKIQKYKLDDSSPAYEVTDIYRPDYMDSTAVDRTRKKMDSLIQSKSLKYYLIINKNIEQNDSCFLVAKSFGFRTGSRFDRTISSILAEIRLEKSNLNLSVDSVMVLARRTYFEQQAPGGKERDFETVYLAGLVLVMIIFMTVVAYGQTLMRSVIDEKNSRIIEVMVSSISPFQLMSGKIIGLGLASLTQVAIWIAIGLGLYGFQGSLEISATVSDIIFNPVLIGFFLIFMALGYLLFSTLFALIGAIVNNEKEAQNFIFPIIMTIMVPVILSMYIYQEPDSTIVTVLSLIPLFTPTMMLVRLNVIGSDVFDLADPIMLEATLGVIITALTTVAVIWLTSRIFRIGILMYGKRPTLPEIIKWVTYK
jgi:ABC-2 type transport system permease protein